MLQVRNAVDMKLLMMQNKWQLDPLSQGCPGNAIASRFDLAAPECRMNRVANGATDAKVTTAKWARNGRVIIAICGPTHDDQPVFRWDNPLFSGSRHDGQPLAWNFQWQQMVPAVLASSGNSTHG